MLGYDERLRRHVAIKMHNRPGDRGSRRRLLREARTVARMDSPRLVKVLDVVESDSYLAMIMEYVSGCSLAGLLAATRPALASVLTLGIDVAGALAISRQHRVVHGDLKPANVLIGENGHARLTDFGISGRVEQDSGRRQFAGSAESMSPEQCAGDPVDWRSDMFALGILLYRMLGGQHPFYSAGRLDTALLQRDDPQPLRELIPAQMDVPAALLAVVDDLLQKDPGKRPRNTRGVRQVMRAALRDIPVVAHDSLLQQAQPLFRSEVADDPALRITVTGGRGARSRLPPERGHLRRLVHRLRGLSAGGRVAAALGLAAACALPVAVAVHNRETVVRLDPVEFSLPVQSPVPRALSPAWLAREVRSALPGALGTVRVVGDVAADPRDIVLTTGGVVDMTPPAEQRLTIALRCSEDFCVLALGRATGDAHYSAQRVLLPDAHLAHWRSVVRASTAELFP